LAALLSDIDLTEHSHAAETPEALVFALRAHVSAPCRPSENRSAFLSRPMPDGEAFFVSWAAPLLLKSVVLPVFSGSALRFAIGVFGEKYGVLNPLDWRFTLQPC
jgi:hypothetical protein